LVQCTEGVNYYRADLPARYLPGKVMVEVPIVRSGPDTMDFPEQEGVGIWMFAGSPFRAGMIAMMKANGTPVLMEVDDNYTVQAPVSFGAWNVRHTDNPIDHSFESHVQIVPHMDGVIVSTPRLGRVYRKLHDRIWVCPNQIDPRDWPQDPEHQPGGVLRVGWSASDSHKIDAPLVKDGLEWASRQDGVEVVIIGMNPRTFKWDFPHRHIPFKPMAEYRQEVQNIDLMVTPCKPGAWADCKSDVKALEAGINLAAPVVSRTEPYKTWWDRTVSCSTRREWTQAIRYLVKRPDEVRDMARAARDYVLKERTIQGNVWRWREAVDEADRLRRRDVRPVPSRPRELSQAV
jgi:hypothetical protein